MNASLHRRPPGLLRATRTAGDAARTRSTVWLVGVPHTETAVRTHRLRAVLHRASEFLSATPWARAAYDTAPDAAQNPSADGEALRDSLETVALMAGRAGAARAASLARDELGASYSIAVEPKGDGTRLAAG